MSSSAGTRPHVIASVQFVVSLIKRSFLSGVDAHLHLSVEVNPIPLWFIRLKSILICLTSDHTQLLPVVRSLPCCTYYHPATMMSHCTHTPWSLHSLKQGLTGAQGHDRAYWTKGKKLKMIVQWMSCSSSALVYGRRGLSEHFTPKIFLTKGLEKVEVKVGTWECEEWETAGRDMTVKKKLPKVLDPSKVQALRVRQVKTLQQQDK